MTLKIIFNQKILIMLFIIAGSLFPQSSMEWMNQMALYEAVRLYEEEKENMNLTNNRTMLYELEKEKYSFWDNALYTAWKAVDTIVDWATATNWYKLGLSYYEKGQYEEAINSFKKAVELKPNNDMNWYRLGRSYYDNGQYKEAINSFKKAVELKPNDAYNWLWLGLSYFFNEQYKEAINSLKKAVELNPNDANNWYWLGRSYNKNGEYEEAVNSLKKAVELNPNNENKKYLENLLKELNKK